MTEVLFDFSDCVLPLIIEEMRLAEEYIRIAMFQIHNDRVFEVLNNKLNQGLRIEIFTLPIDSIDEIGVRLKVESYINELIKNGAKIYFNKWNVGKPERTTTAAGRWYLFHGKFIVTDKSAIALSANFTQNEELDAVIIFREDSDRIKDFNIKFDELSKIFVKADNGYDGQIHRKIAEIVGKGSLIFELPKTADLIHKNHWIRHYPFELCKSNVPIKERLYLTPFDCKGRDFLVNLIEDANEFVYISTESFTDDAFSQFLIKTSVNRGTNIKILSGTKSMDFTDRINNMFRELLAQEIELRTTDENLHGKLVLTDKALAISSINLNKINLGWNITSKYWRENTESILICKDPIVMERATKQYLKVFRKCFDVREKLSQKLEKKITRVFSQTFNLRSRKEVKKIFAGYILKKQIDIPKMIIKIGKVTKQLMECYARQTVEKEDLISALVLYHLSERGKQDYNQLNEKMSELDEKINLKTLIANLEFRGLVEKEDDFFKINIESLRARTK